MGQKAFSGVLGLVALVALGAPGPAGSEGDPNAFVECQSGGRKVLTRRSQCMGAIVRDFAAEEDAAAPSADWIARDSDRGILLTATLACRSRRVLDDILSSAAENRRHLARVAAEAGDCAVLPAHTSLVLKDEASGLLQVAHAEWGSLWLVSPGAIPGLTGTTMPARLRRAGPSSPARGLTVEEQARVESELADRPTVSGYGGRAVIGGASHVPGVREAEQKQARRGHRGDAVLVKRKGMHAQCRCANGTMTTTLRSGLDACDEACGVQGSKGSNEAEADTCRFHGFATDCPTSGALKADERMGTPIVEDR